MWKEYEKHDCVGLWATLNISGVSGCVFICIFASQVGAPIGITSSGVWRFVQPFQE